VLFECFVFLSLLLRRDEKKSQKKKEERRRRTKVFEKKEKKRDQKVRTLFDTHTDTNTRTTHTK